MVGIVSYGAYVPMWRLSRAAIHPGGKGEKAICGHDEDSITMAVTATMKSIQDFDRGRIDGLFFATTTSPYLEKMSAPMIALAADLRREVTTADFANSLRAGTAALNAAIDAVKAEQGKKIVVVASDCRQAVPRSALEGICGDGAGALVIGDEEVAVAIENRYSVLDEIMDIWRSHEDRFVRYWEERFTSTEGYQRVVNEAVSGLMKKYGYKPADFAKVVLYTPDARGAAQVAAKNGFNVKTQLQDPLFDVLGNTGAAYAVMLLLAALEDVSTGDRILLASYGNGCDTFVLQATEQMERLKERQGIKWNLKTKKTINDYLQYLRWREILPKDRQRVSAEFISAPALWRERDANLALRGVECSKCGALQYPPQRVCARCKTKDSFRSYRFSDKKARILTFSMDYIESTPEPPTVTTTVEFESGGRMECYMTDREITEVKVGLEVEMSFRKLHFLDGIHNYFWKSMPIRGIQRS
jgi:3-hydroxy-3-methylglutaryl CoA synthase